MKRYVIIGLLLLLVGAMIYSLMKPEPVEYKAAAEFKLTGELATTVGDKKISLNIQVNEELSELVVYYEDSVIGSWKKVKKDVQMNFAADDFGIGSHVLILRAKRLDGSSSEDRRLVRVLSDILPEQIEAREIQAFGHSTLNFTQGLEFYKGQLYEGTGDPEYNGSSNVGRVNLATGEWIQKMGVPGFFAEGITILNDKLYQLTYKSGKCFVYNADSLTHVKEFSYTGEGWGLCNDGKWLIMSNGTEYITFRDPESFSTVRTIQVYNTLGPITNLNELEYIDGKIYANVWMTNRVAVIDPATGKLLQEIDASSLSLSGKGTVGDVLNGIAHNPETGKIYMTGKRWSKLFEVEFVPVALP